MNAFAALPVSEGVYREADFEAVRALVYSEAGIVLPAGKAMLVYSRLAPLVRASGSVTFARYVQQIEADRGERAKAVGALTTNHTFFYREAHHFEHFRDHVRASLVRRLEQGGRVRIWSAGCSSGEETWSLAMTLFGEDRASGRTLAKRDLVILASDIADHALQAGREASYPAASLDAVPAALRRAWVRRQNDRATIAEEVRACVRFRALNLLGGWPMRQRFDVIFCRNVMIYFDQPTKERLIARFAEALLPGGLMYIGHSERVTGPAEAMLTAIGNTIYQRRAQ